MKRMSVALVLLTILAGPPAWAYVHRESVEKTIPVDGRTAISVSNPSGLIKVRPVDGAVVALEATKVAKATNEGAARELAEQVKVRIVEGSDEIEIKVEIPSRFERGSGISDFLGIGTRRQVEVELYIQVPPSMKVKLATASGDVDVEGVEAGGDIDAASGDVWVSGCSGDFTVGVASGDAEVAGIRGNLSISSASGGLSIRDIRGSVEVSIASGDFVGRMIEGTFSLDGASGDVTVEECKGEVDVDTASGDVWLKDVVSELSVNTSSGDVTAYTRADGVPSVDISCSSGDIELSLPETGSYRLEIGTVSGSIHCKVPLSVEKVTRHELRGKVGSAKGSVNLNTSSGDIKVHVG